MFLINLYALRSKAVARKAGKLLYTYTYMHAHHQLCSGIAGLYSCLGPRLEGDTKPRKETQRLAKLAVLEKERDTAIETGNTS